MVINVICIIIIIFISTCIASADEKSAAHQMLMSYGVEEAYNIVR